MPFAYAYIEKNAAIPSLIHLKKDERIRRA